ncbi:ABC transporter permease [Myxococcota bacterium]
MMAIARREFRSYFDSPLAYVVVCASFCLLGVLFFLMGGFWQAGRASLEKMFHFAPWGLCVLVVPVITMRLLAEEKRSGTLEMLITLPVKDSDVILGKYLGALGLVLTLMAATSLYPVTMFWWPWNLGPIDQKALVAGYVGLVLMSAAAVAIGLLISALTESQAVAFFITFIVLVVLWWVLAQAARTLGGWLGQFLNYASFDARLSGFTKGLVDTRDVVFFLSVTALALMVSFRVLERRRWA